MTTIIGLQGDGFAILAADTLMLNGSKPYVSDGMHKIRLINGVWIGFAGDGIAIDMVDGWEPDTHTWHRLAMSLKAHFASKGYTHGDEAWEALCLVHGMVVQISADYSWLCDDDGIYAIGSGGDYAIGALAYMNRQWANAEKAIRAAKAALKVSERYDVNTGGEHQIVIQEESDVNNG